MSDDKALALQGVSNAAKRLANMERLDITVWTEKFETILSKLTIDELQQLERMLGTLKPIRS